MSQLERDLERRTRERLRLSVTKGHEPTDEDAIGALAEIEQLQELLRGTGANRYWEGRWREEAADNARLRAALNEMRSRDERNGSLPPAYRMIVDDALKDTTLDVMR